jgi:hypothetical protein
MMFKHEHPVKAGEKPSLIDRLVETTDEPLVVLDARDWAKQYDEQHKDDEPKDPFIERIHTEQSTRIGKQVIHSTAPLDHTIN